MFSVLGNGLVWAWNLLPEGVQFVLGLGCKIVDKTADIAGTLKL